MSGRVYHLPDIGNASGLDGPALCGRWARYLTGDYALLYRLARQAWKDGEAGHYCRRCLRVLNKTAPTCGAVLDYGPNTTRCRLEKDHDGSHSDGPRRWN
jgi:hypothetical protein